MDLKEKLVRSSNAMYVYQNVRVKFYIVAEIDKNKNRFFLP